MKRCPTCNRTYTDLSLNFCLEDGTPLTTAGPDPNATIRYPDPRDTSEPPPTEIYHPPPSPAPRPTTPSPPPPPPQQWRPTPQPAPQKRSNAVWWILGGLAAAVVIGVGLVVMLIALASLGANSNTSNLNANRGNDNRNSNINTNVNTNVNSNANTTTPTSIADDFSQQKWGVGTSPYGRIWYDKGEYHMVSKERTFVVMYAPSNDYNTENATVSVTARSVDGSVPSAGFGLMVHCVQKAGKLEDYALLIYPEENEPSYQIIMHKAGVQSSLVERTESDAIKPGSAPNKLEIRIKGGDLFFYANGQYLTRINDSGNYRRGRAGLYTSDIHEVAFDDLSIER